VAIVVLSLLALGGPSARAANDRRSYEVLLSNRARGPVRVAAARKLQPAAFSSRLVALIHPLDQVHGRLRLHLNLLEEIGQGGSPEALPVLLRDLRRRPLRGGDDQRRLQADMVAAVQITERHGSLQEVEDQIAAILAARFAARPRDARLAIDLVYLLRGARLALGSAMRSDQGVVPEIYRARLNGPSVRTFVQGLRGHEDADVRRMAAWYLERDH